MVRAGPARDRRGAERVAARRGLHGVRHRAGLRPRASSHPDHLERPRRRERRPRGAVPVRVHEDWVPRTGVAGQPVAAGEDARRQARDAVEHVARPVRGRRPDGAAAHCGRRHLPGRALPAVRRRGRGRAVHGVPRAPAREPVALHVLRPHGPPVHPGVVAGDAGSCRRDADRNAPDRGDEAARPRRGRGRAARRGAEGGREGARRARHARRSRPERRGARFRVRVRCGCRSSWVSSGTRT